MYIKPKIVRSILFYLEKRSVGNRTEGGGRKKGRGEKKMQEGGELILRTEQILFNSSVTRSLW